MKRKRPNVKSKQKLASVYNVDEEIQNVVRANAHEWGLDDNYEVEERVEIEMAEKGSKRRNQQASGKNVKGVDPMLKDSRSPIIESDVTKSTNFSRKTRSKVISGSRGLSPLSSDADLVQDDRSQQKFPTPPHQNLQYKDQELKAVLAVIRKVMKMDAAAPFNLPVDPDALGIPDYLDVIETPMDFSTICNNLENGLKYLNSKDVFRDVQYIWENCIKYNRKGHYILELMWRVKKKFMMLWTEVGLFTDQQLDTDGYMQSATKSAGTCSIYEHNRSMGALADCAKYSQQDRVNLSRLQCHHPFLSYAHSYQPQLTPYDSPPSSPESLARRSPDSLEAGRRRNPCGHGCQVDATDTISTHTQFHQHYQFSVGDSKSRQPLQKPCNCHPTRDQSQHSHELGDTFMPTAEHSLRESRARQVEDSQPKHYLHQSAVNCSQQHHGQNRSCQHISNSGRQLFPQSVSEFDISNAGDFAYQQHDQHSCCYGHRHQPQVETCRNTLSSKERPTNSAKPCAGVDMVNAEEEFRPSPIPESMIRYTKHVPSKYLISHMPDDHQRQDKKATSPPPLHHPFLNCTPMERRGINRSSSQVHATSDKPHAHIDMDGSDEFLSPPPAESMISSAKRELITDPADVALDLFSHQQQEEISPSQTRPQKGSPEDPVSSSQPHPSHPDTAPLDMLRAVPSEVKKKNRGRGPTRCLDVWNSKDKISVSTNEFGEPIGPEAPKFIFFLGTIARNGHIAPLNYINWKALPDENKERMWQLVKSKFLVDQQSKGSILKSIGTKWKNWKALLKANHYSPHETDEDRLADCNERVQPDQWRILVSFWNSAEAKERSNTNKTNRSKYTSNHACGSKSFARVREEQLMKRPGRKEPSQADLFIATRTRKNGQPVNETSSVIISQLRKAAQQQGASQKDTNADNVFVQVMGEETPGRVPTPGVGTTLSKLNTLKPLPTEAVRIVSEAKDEVHEMREKMVAMEQTCAQMAAQIATMMTMMQNKFSGKDTADGDASRNSDRSEQSLSSNRGVSSLKRSTSGKH